MRKLSAIIIAGLAILSCAKNNPSAFIGNAVKKVEFIGTLADTRVSTSEGKSVWEKDDLVSIFSVNSDGTIVGGNTLYKVQTAGTTAEFIPVDQPVQASDKYYAFSNGMLKYPYDLSTSPATITAGNDVTDYKLMPVTVNDRQTFIVDETSGLSSIVADKSDYKLFYAAADAPEGSDPVQLSFTPILPILEIGLLGSGELKSFTIEDAGVAANTNDRDKAKAANTWLSAKGVFDMSTGTLTTTNISTTAYRRITATLKTASKESVTLSKTTPVRCQLNIGRFNISGGLKITFNFADNTTAEKTIWKDQTVSALDESGNCKHIYQPVLVPAIEDAYYKIALADVDWTESYIHDIYNTGGSRIAVITKEYLGATVDRQAIVVYPLASGKPDYTKGLVAEVTVDQAGAAPSGNIHGGSISISDMTPGNAVYAAGTSAAATYVYVKSDGSAVYASNPATDAETVGNGSVTPEVLDNGEFVHPLVKLGTQVWIACCYKTKKDNKGVSFDIKKSGEPRTGDSDDNRDMLIVDENNYIYSAYAIGHTTTKTFSDRISPSGWSVPSGKNWTSLGTFLGETSMYAKISSGVTLQGYKNLTYKSNVDSKTLIYSAPTTQPYYGTWTSDPYTTAKKANLAIAKENTKPSGASNQACVLSFEVRLIRK